MAVYCFFIFKYHTSTYHNNNSHKTQHMYVIIRYTSSFGQAMGGELSLIHIQMCIRDRHTNVYVEQRVIELKTNILYPQTCGKCIHKIYVRDRERKRLERRIPQIPGTGTRPNSSTGTVLMRYFNITLYSLTLYFTLFFCTQLLWQRNT